MQYLSVEVDLAQLPRGEKLATASFAEKNPTQTPRHNVGTNACQVSLSKNTMDSVEADEVCASCGIAAGDNIKLKICTACKLVKYCSVDCQKNHRPQHKKACKKRAAEIRDDDLFTQPEGSSSNNQGHRMGTMQDFGGAESPSNILSHQSSSNY